VKCLGCNTHQTVALNIIRRPKTTLTDDIREKVRALRAEGWLQREIAAEVGVSIVSVCRILMGIA